MSTVKSFKDLLVWQKGMQLVKLVYQLTHRLPPSERFGLTNQVQRSAVSVPANISEGWGRKRTGSYIQFLSYATGSLYETQTHILIAKELKYLEDRDTKNIEALMEELSKMLYKLTNTLETRKNN